MNKNMCSGRKWVSGRYFVLALFVMLVQKGFAQTDSCIIKLKNAGVGYEQGDYDGTIRMLQSALSGCSLSREDKIQANKLLILSYLKIDNLEEADRAAERIMNLDPYYKPDKFKDDPKLSALFEKYHPAPQFRIGIRGGINLASVDVVQSYSIVHPDNASGLDEYKKQAGFQLGLTSEYKTWKDLWLSLEFQFRQSKYEHLLYDVENTTIDYSEKLSYLDVPLSFKYYFLKGDVKPYLQAGASFSFLSGAISTTTRDDLKDLVDRIDLRNKFATGFLAGAGLSYAVKGIQFFMDARYVYYPDNVNKEGTRYSDPVNVFKYYYLDDDFRLDIFQVSVGVSYAIVYKNVKEK